jgi:ADP-heptose:LPS heptosyltransferase
MRSKLILRSFLSPGDIVMLTAAVRDLHHCYPNQFETDVRTSCPQLWDFNPYLTPLTETDPGVQLIDCDYPLIHRCNETPYHCLHGYIEFLNDRLKLAIKPTAFKGDLHIADIEKSWCSQVCELTGEDTPFWIIVSGGKYDLTIKWWDVRRYQQVVDHFRGKIQFVQVGNMQHYHPKLDGVIDFRRKTDLRQLVRLVYHSQGVLCGVTALMHLAAAVETKAGDPVNRPCVVIAGGREPVHWEAYPHHQFIHTLGALSCCQNGGCWRSRTAPLGDGDDRDNPENLCLNVVRDLPRCMDMINAEEVIRRIELYYTGGALKYLSSAQAMVCHHAMLSAGANSFEDEPLNMYNARIALDSAVRDIPPYPGNCHGRGIVICGGGTANFTNAWVCINLLRHLGCRLPIQLWYLGEGELDDEMKSLVAPLDVECVDGNKIRKEYPVRILGESELKAYALLYSRFKEVLFLEANNVPVTNPEYLFETSEFRQTGAIFWPDRDRLAHSRFIWRVCGLPCDDQPEFESGQILANKEKCWEPLKLALWYNENSDFFYQHIHGEKETFQLAFRRLDKSYSMPEKAMHPLEGIKCQHDFQGNRIFQHRTRDRWTLSLNNKQVKDFWYEAECRSYLRSVQQIWDGSIGTSRSGGKPLRTSAQSAVRTIGPIGENAPNTQPENNRLESSTLPVGRVEVLLAGDQE